MLLNQIVSYGKFRNKIFTDRSPEVEDLSLDDTPPLVSDSYFSDSDSEDSSSDSDDDLPSSNINARIKSTTFLPSCKI